MGVDADAMELVPREVSGVEVTSPSQKGIQIRARARVRVRVQRGKVTKSAPWTLWGKGKPKATCTPVVDKKEHLAVVTEHHILGPLVTAHRAQIPRFDQPRRPRLAHSKRISQFGSQTGAGGHKGVPPAGQCAEPARR